MSLVSQTTEWRMPRKRPSPAAISASSTRATPSPRRRSACPTMPAHSRLLPYCPLAVIAAVPLTNSTSPTGFISAGPVGAVHRATFDKDALRDVVTADGIGEQLVEQVSVAGAIPQMMVRIDDLEGRLQDFLFPLRPPCRIAVSRPRRGAAGHCSRGRSHGL